MCNSANYFVFIGTMLASLSIMRTSMGQQSCVNNSALRTNNAKWTCTLRTNCSLASTLSAKLTVLCGKDKICCPGRLTTTTSKSTSSPGDDFAKANKIASEKCYEYAGYRYNNYTIPGKLFTDKPINKSKLDCNEVQTLIVGGKDAFLKDFPHMALLGYDDDVTDENSWRCGGSLISEQFILSAAHCTVDGAGKQVKWAALGLLSRENFTTDMIDKNLFKIIQPFNHPQYKVRNTKHENNDIALYKLKNPIKLGPIIRPICIYHEGSPIATNANVIATGWGQMGTGMTESTSLKKVSILNLDASECVTTHKDNPSLQGGFDVNKMICAGHPTEARDTCLGDSGGPIQVRKRDMKCMWVHVGITSIGPSNCGENLPGIYTRISAYLPWIQKIVWPA